MRPSEIVKLILTIDKYDIFIVISNININIFLLVKRKQKKNSSPKYMDFLDKNCTSSDLRVNDDIDREGTEGEEKRKNS